VFGKLARAGVRMMGSFVALIDSSPLLVRVGTPVISGESVSGCKTTGDFEKHTNYVASSGKVVKLRELIRLDTIIRLNTAQVNQPLNAISVLDDIEEYELLARNSRGV
jgi:hypothetical protein